LNVLPLHACPIGDGEERLCDRYDVSYAPSLRIWARQRRLAPPSPQAALLVVNPTQDRSLAFAALEAALLTPLFPDLSCLVGSAATIAAVEAALVGRAYVHFACHGVHDQADPSRSGIDLADGRLTPDRLDVSRADYSAIRVVTLSACESGLTDVGRDGGDDFLGLPGSLLSFGVPCLISTLWQVEDASAALLCYRLYSNHLRGGITLAGALREAQVWLRSITSAEVVGLISQAITRDPRLANDPLLYAYLRHHRYRARARPDDRPFANLGAWGAFRVIEQA
jgi:CHAT domain-containing protein